MGLASSARASSALTAAAYKLVPAVEVELLPTGFYAVNGECGHRLEVVRKHEASRWQERIDAKRRHRKRCTDCIQDTDAHQAKLILGW